MAQKREVPVAERRDLSVKKRRELIRQRMRDDGVRWPREPERPVEVLTLEDLRPPMRRALLLAANNGILAGEDGVHRSTVRALEARGLVHKRTSKKGRSAYRPTDVGRGLIAQDAPVFLHQRMYRNYTRDPAQAVRGEDPCMHEIAPKVIAPPAVKRQPEETLRESIAAMKARLAAGAGPVAA